MDGSKSHTVWNNHRHRDCLWTNAMYNCIHTYMICVYVHIIGHCGSKKKVTFDSNNRCTLLSFYFILCLFAFSICLYFLSTFFPFLCVCVPLLWVNTVEQHKKKKIRKKVRRKEGNEIEKSERKRILLTSVWISFFVCVCVLCMSLFYSWHYGYRCCCCCWRK